MDSLVQKTERIDFWDDHHIQIIFINIYHIKFHQYWNDNKIHNGKLVDKTFISFENSSITIYTQEWNLTELIFNFFKSTSKRDL